MLKALFYFSIVFLSLGQFSAIYKSGSTNIYIFDLLVVLLAFVGLLHRLAIKRSLKIPSYFIPFVLFTLMAFLSLLVSSYPPDSTSFFVSFSYLFRWMSYLIVGLLLFNLIEEGYISDRKITGAIISTGILVSAAGFIQLLVLPDFEVLDPSLGWDPHKNRLASTFFDPNFTGAYLVICFVYLLERFKDKKDRPIVLALIMALILLAVFLTFSRSAWAMLAVVIMVYGIFRYRILLLASLILAFSAYYAVPRVQTRISGVTDPSDSAHFRVISWGNTLSIAKDNLTTGVGFNAFRYAQREYGYLSIDSESDHSSSGSDSSLLLVLATTGVIGFILFLSGFLYPGIIGLVSNKEGGILLVSVFSSLLIHSQFVNSLFYPQILFLWLVTLALFSHYSLRT